MVKDDDVYTYSYNIKEKVYKYSHNIKEIEEFIKNRKLSKTKITQINYINHE